jgi:hypothetical protein
MESGVEGDLGRRLARTMSSEQPWARQRPVVTRDRGVARSGGEAVLVDKTAENVAPTDRPHRAGDGPWARRLEVEAAVGSSPVVVLHVLAKHFLQVATREHKHVI